MRHGIATLTLGTDDVQGFFAEAQFAFAISKHSSPRFISALEATVALRFLLLLFCLVDCLCLNSLSYIIINLGLPRLFKSSRYVLRRVRDISSRAFCLRIYERAGFWCRCRRRLSWYGSGRTNWLWCCLFNSNSITTKSPITDPDLALFIGS
jgi:hypothetical protein